MLVVVVMEQSSGMNSDSIVVYKRTGIKNHMCIVYECTLRKLCFRSIST